MIYRVVFTSTDGNQGYYFTTNKRDANKKLATFRKDCKIKDEYGEEFFPCIEESTKIMEEIQTPKNLKEWIDLLNRVASHNDNG